jgi:flagellar basal-body rod modification protein FlgD
MAVESIGAVLREGDASIQRGALGQEDFLRILLQQLAFQDPLKPLENQEFMAQLAQFTSLEQTVELNGRVDSLITQQAATQSLGLLGRTVEARTDSGEIVGEISTVTFREGEPNFTLVTGDGAVFTDVRLSQISIVR